MRIQNLYYKLGGEKGGFLQTKWSGYIQKKTVKRNRKLLQDKGICALDAMSNLEPCLEPIVIKGLFLMMMIWTLPCGQKTVLGILKMYYLNMVSIKKELSIL